jgi:hypothetical protein
MALYTGSLGQPAYDNSECEGGLPALFRQKERQVQQLHSKQQLHELIDQLSDAHAEALLIFAQLLNADPVTRSVLLAPFDDEPVTAEEQARVEAALADPRPPVPFEHVKDLFD